MRYRFNRPVLHVATLCGAALLFSAGCNKKADNTANFTNAIDTYYAAKPACLWSDPVKFPLQVATADASKTAPYDALVDQGLLARTTVEKKKLIVMSEQANNYDLSDKGRSAWTADTSQPGFGNFCYGHRKVSGITSSTPTTDQTGATTQVAYGYTYTDVPAWANSAEMQTAFPDLHTNIAGPLSAQATLTDTPNGWQVSSAPDSLKHSAPATAADGKIVQ